MQYKILSELFTGESIGRKKNGLPKKTPTWTALTTTLQEVNVMAKSNVSLKTHRGKRMRGLTLTVRMSFRTCTELIKKPLENPTDFLGAKKRR